MWDDSIVIQSGSLTVVSFGVMKEAIVLVAYFARCTFALYSEISSVFLPGEFGRVSILFIKLI